MRTVYICDGHCFVKHPHLRGLYLKCDLSVAKIDCPVCGSKVGIPCTSSATGVVMAGTHYQRRGAWKRQRRAELADELRSLSQ
jgi:hypothetical protein